MPVVMDALRRLPAIRDEKARWWALGALASRLPSGELVAALRREAHGDWLRYSPFGNLLEAAVPFLTAEECQALANEVRVQRGRGDWTAWRLVILAAGLPTASARDLRLEALAMLAEVRDDGGVMGGSLEISGPLLGRLAVELDGVARQQAVEQAVAQARRLQDAKSRIDVFTLVTPVLSPHVRQEVVREVIGLVNEDLVNEDHDEWLVPATLRFAHGLTDDASRAQVLEAARQYAEAERDGDLLLAVAKELSAGLRSNMAAKAFRINLRRYPDLSGGSEGWVEFLTEAAPYLPEEVLPDALDVAARVGNVAHSGGDVLGCSSVETADQAAAAGYRRREPTRRRDGTCTSGGGARDPVGCHRGSRTRGDIGFVDRRRRTRSRDVGPRQRRRGERLCTNPRKTRCRADGDTVGSRGWWGHPKRQGARTLSLAGLGGLSRADPDTHAEGSAEGGMGSRCVRGRRTVGRPRPRVARTRGEGGARHCVST